MKLNELFGVKSDPQIDAEPSPVSEQHVEIDEIENINMTGTHVLEENHNAMLLKETSPRAWRKLLNLD